MILVDTSVWIEHLRKGVPALAAALEREEVLMHPFVLGELACGRLVHRTEVLQLMAELPSAFTASDEEALQFIDGRALMGRGIGTIDVHLLAAVMLDGTARLWTRDKRLGAIATELGMEYAGQDYL